MDEVARAGILDFQSLKDLFTRPLPEGLEWLAFILAGFILAIIVISSLAIATALNTWFERRMLGRVQSRLGPNRWGPFGLLQPLADAAKLIIKEDIIPAVADRPLFTLAPIMMLVPGFLVVAVLPFGKESFLGRLNVGVLFVIAVTGIHILGVFMAGWASRNKYAMFGAMRGVAMLISYEVPMALSLVAVVIAAGSLSLPELLRGEDVPSSMSLLGIVEAQRIPFLLLQPLGFLVFIAAASAEMSRTPFDMIESESELVGGYLTEYSGAKFAIFQLTEFMAPLVTATLTTVLFLGGTRGYAPIPGQVWFLLKFSMVVLLLLWMRATWPRLRIDQIMGFAWKGLFPLALLNMFLVAVEVLLLQNLHTGEISTGHLIAMAAVNWAMAVVCIIVVANLLGQPRLKRAAPTPSPLANMNVEAD